MDTYYYALKKVRESACTGVAGGGGSPARPIDDIDSGVT